MGLKINKSPCPRRRQREKEGSGESRTYSAIHPSSCAPVLLNVSARAGGDTKPRISELGRDTTKEHSLFARTSRDLALHFGLDTHHLHVRVRVRQLLNEMKNHIIPTTRMRTLLHSLSWATTDDDDCLAFCA